MESREYREFIEMQVRVVSLEQALLTIATDAASIVSHPHLSEDLALRIFDAAFNAARGVEQ